MRPTPLLTVAQVAAAIAILQATGIRLGNLAAIDMRKNLIARGRRVYLVIAEAGTKNGEPIDFELPEATLGVVAPTTLVSTCLDGLRDLAQQSRLTICVTEVEMAGPWKSKPPTAIRH